MRKFLTVMIVVLSVSLASSVSAVDYRGGGRDGGGRDGGGRDGGGREYGGERVESHQEIQRQRQVEIHREGQQRGQQQREEQQQRMQQRYPEQQRQQMRDMDRQRMEQWPQDQGRQERGRYNWSHPAFQGSNWHKTAFSSDHPSPFRWHDSRGSMFERFGLGRYRMDRINDRDWDDRFPGLHSFWWHDDDFDGRGFWYRGNRIYDCSLFFNDYDELVGIGFMYDDNFIFERDDASAFEIDDPIVLQLFVNLF